MKNFTRIAAFAALAALAVTGFCCIEKFPFVGVPARAENVASSAKAKAVAEDFSPEKNLDLSGERIAYTLPAGISAKIVGSTYEQLVDFEGKIRHPLSPKTTKLTFELTDAAGERALTKTFEVAVPVEAPHTADIPHATTALQNAKPHVVPALQEWMGAAHGLFFVPQKETLGIVVLNDSAEFKPTLRERAELFAAELSELFGEKISVSTDPADASKKGKIILRIASQYATTALATLGKEAYLIEATPDALSVASADPLGAFWGTRTLLQVFKQNQNAFPCGTAVDYPQYPLRGFMYDIGRKPTTLEAIENVLKTMAYYKLNDYHLVINNNFIWMERYTDSPDEKKASPEQKARAIQDVLEAAPTAFRLESSVVGKNGTPLTSTDRFYTKKEFGALMDLAKLYGVQIVPEIDVPGHAMSFVRVRPELMYRGVVQKPHDVERAAMLDVSGEIFDPATGRTFREETLAFVQSVFDEYLVGKNGEEPVFRDAPIHIGTDEYYGEAEDYRAFADAMIRYIKSRGRTPRLWGSLSRKAGETPVDSSGAQIDLWNQNWFNPQQAFDEGFDIINILYRTSYVVPNGTGSVGGYGDLLDLPFLYSQAWQPHKIGDTTLIAGHPKILGAQWALWNDNTFRGDTGLTDFDLFDRIHETCAVIAEKTWNTGEDVAYAEFRETVSAVAFPPLSNPKYRVPANDGKNTLFFMAFDEKQTPFKDLSGNGNDAVETKNVGTAPAQTPDSSSALELRGNESFVKLPLSGIAPDYTAEFWVKRATGTPADKPQVLFSSPVGKILAVQKDTGKVGVTRDTWDYSFDYTLPENRWVKLKFVAQGRTLTLFADDVEIGAPVRNRFPETHKFSTFVFPLEYIGDRENAFSGLIDSVKISKKE